MTETSQTWRGTTTTTRSWSIPNGASNDPRDAIETPRGAGNGARLNIREQQ